MPFHGFDLTFGEMCFGSCKRRNGVVPNAMHLKTYPTYEAMDISGFGGEISPHGLAAPQFFDNLDSTFIYGSAHDPWNAHYSRVIENH
jgi:hypothetical protein